MAAQSSRLKNAKNSEKNLLWNVLSDFFSFGKNFEIVINEVRRTL